ncbi:hypothetical protein BU23DRAFT_240335 [Bimuria novae-zelandiae CBS 107.79]|uniref:Spindle pole body component n=1 Tax=Bimuria novae-zelandiae CBS 107.79 TaxID=1447943 RepID=A0A6A5V7V0_9PLEO|nr:hypothetical protein BU23DRAFT_240335 [Bimuria novae-zelandiae CBS 107.79]
MAQNAKVAALTDELIHSILKFDPNTNRQAYKHAKDIAKSGLRAHQYARTNQFDVQQSFVGLDEKFRVLNRDDLADALDERVKEINEYTGKWIPECLSLLLLLSDRPTENSRVDALELLRPPTPPPELTWEQILAEDPYSDEEIWKDIDYAADSSEDDLLPPEKEKAKPSPPTSVEEDDIYDPEETIVTVETDVVEELQKAQFWKHPRTADDEKVEITELQAVRETLFMLAGLKTSLFHADRRVKPEYELSHAMTKTTYHQLTDLGHIGKTIYQLRQWVKRSASLPLVQTFEAAVANRLLAYDQSLARLQRRYLVPESPITVSLLEVHTNVKSMSRPILRLAQLIVDIEPQLLVNPFIHLEILFDQISLAQMTLEKDVFDYLSHIFFECLRTYLKPMRKWMESGHLGLNDETFFVFENDSGSEMASLWHDRFVLRRGQENKLRSPSFLEPAAQKIFNTGKSVIFLKELGIHTSQLPATVEEPLLDHNTVCGTSPDLPLSTFSELFQAAFQTWISSKYSLASTVLREYLLRDCGLVTLLNNLRIIHLSANGSAFQDLADAVFERMDSGQRTWNDRFLLTELARGVFTTVLPRSESERIIVRAVRRSTKSPTESVKALAHISIDYALPWPIMNVIQRSSLPVYQQLSIFLLQTYRAKYLLQRISPQSIGAIQTAPLRRLGYKLRQRLMWFADVMRSYLTETVIELAFTDMKAAISKAEDIDEMANVHMRYVARLQDQALLSDNLKPIHRGIIALLDLAVVFSQHHAGMQRGTKAKSKPSVRETRRKVSGLSHETAEEESDSSNVGDDDDSVDSPSSGQRKLEDGLAHIEREFERLLPFVTAGLRSVGRVGAEPVWEMLADRLSWNTSSR